MLEFEINFCLFQLENSIHLQFLRESVEVNDPYTSLFNNDLWRHAVRCRGIIHLVFLHDLSICANFSVLGVTLAEKSFRSNNSQHRELYWKLSLEALKIINERFRTLRGA